MYDAIQPTKEIYSLVCNSAWFLVSDGRIFTWLQERRILKEANAEKKPQCALAKEEETTNILGVHAEKHQSVRVSSFWNIKIKAYLCLLFCFGPFYDIRISIAAGEEHNFQGKSF